MTSTTSTTTSRIAASPYAQLFAIPGTKSFCISGAIARLPISMMSLGIVLALNYLYDNWTVAGSMSAAYILAVASVTPLYARLFDRFGQRRIGTVALSIQVIAMLGFAFAAWNRVPIPLLFALAIVMGFTQFSFGALVRTRWTYALRDSDNMGLLNTAYALEAAIDEIVFIVGPILAAFLATSVHPVSQLFVPTLACGIGGAVFFSLNHTQPPVMELVDVTDNRAASASASAVDSAQPDTLTIRQLRTNAPKPKSALLYPGVLPIMIVFIVFNMSFNAFDVSITASMKAAGVEQWLGLQLAMFAVGSCIGAMIFGSRQMRGSHWQHMMLFLVLLTIGFILFRLAMDHFLLLGAFEVLAGLCVSPLFATGNLIVKDAVPERSLTEGLSWLTTAGAVGTSLGSTLAGAVIDSAGTHASMMIPWISVACSVPLAVFGWLLARKRD